MGVGGSKNKNDEQVPLIQKQINDESEKNYYFPCILKIDYDSDKIELKTETDKTHELYIKDFLGDYTHIYNCSCSNCSKNNLNKLLSTIVECIFPIVSFINMQTSLLSVVWVYSQYFNQDDMYACKE